MSWEDLLANQVRELESQAEGFDPLLADKARHLLRVIRSFEVCVRQLALRADYRLAGELRERRHV
jgi:hypothetical protein